MTQYFTLRTINRIVPHTGECVGDLLAKAAQDASRKLGSQANAGDPIARKHVAQLFYLAADAYELAAGVTLGHGRSWNYHQRASDCIAEAKALAEPVEA